MSTPGGLSWQGGWDEPGVLSVVIVASGSPGTGVFVYSGTPGAGNGPIGWITASATDPYGNTVQPGIMLAEASASGNAEGGLIWNTATPGAAEPLLALYPDATVGFTGNSPFVLGRVFNRGLVNELLALALGGGGTAGSSPVQVELFSQSKDGTGLGHVSFFDWASTNLICDVNVNGIVAANPGSANTLETWHSLSLTTVAGSGNGVNGFRYKAMPDDTLQLEWDLATNSVGNNVTIATLPSAWRPATAHNIASGSYGGSTGLTTGANPHFAVNTSGTIVTGGFAGINFDVCGTARIALD